MANGAVAAPLTRGTQRESVLLPVMPVDEKRFESELRRLDTLTSEDRKNREKFETRIEKSIETLRIDTNKSIETLRIDTNKSIETLRIDTNKSIETLRNDMSNRLAKVETEIKDLRKETSDRLWWIFGAVTLAILVPIILKYI